MNQKWKWMRGFCPNCRLDSAEYHAESASREAFSSEDHELLLRRPDRGLYELQYHDDWKGSGCLKAALEKLRELESRIEWLEEQERQ
jgi:hypothetical protein